MSSYFLIIFCVIPCDLTCLWLFFNILVLYHWLCLSRHFLNDMLRLCFLNLLKEINIGWINITPLIFYLLICRILYIFQQLSGSTSSTSNIDMEYKESNYRYTKQCTYNTNNNNNNSLIYLILCLRYGKYHQIYYA